MTPAMPAQQQAKKRRRSWWITRGNPLRCADGHLIRRDAIALPAIALSCPKQSANGVSGCPNWLYVLSYTPGLLYCVELHVQDLQVISSMSVADVLHYLGVTDTETSS